MSDHPVVLTLIASRLLQDKLVEQLLDHEAAGSAGFIVREVVAYGRNVEFQTTAERISGRVRQVEIQAVLAAEAARESVRDVARTLLGQRVTWLISEVRESGEIA